MQSTITRLALFQFLAVVYSTLGVGTFAKVFSTDAAYAAPPAFAVLLRDYGFLLLPIPAVWLIIASVHAHRPKPGTGDVDQILGSGILLLSALVAIGFFGTVSAAIAATRVVQVDPSPPPMHRRLERFPE